MLPLGGSWVIFFNAPSGLLRSGIHFFIHSQLRPKGGKKVVGKNTTIWQKNLRFLRVGGSGR